MNRLNWRGRIRIAWANRCLLCLFNPFHGEEDDREVLPAGEGYAVPVDHSPYELMIEWRTSPTHDPEADSEKTGDVQGDS